MSGPIYKSPIEERTPFQALHLARLADLFGVDVSPAQALSGPALDAWLLEVEDRLFSDLFA